MKTPTGKCRNKHAMISTAKLPYSIVEGLKIVHPLCPSNFALVNIF